MEGHISSYQEVVTQPDRFTSPVYHTWFASHPTHSSASLSLPHYPRWQKSIDSGYSEPILHMQHKRGGAYKRRVSVL